MQNVYCTDRYNIPNQWHSYWLYPKHSHYSILIGVCVCIEHDPFVKRLCKNRQTEDYCDTSDSVLLGKLMTWKHLLEFANCISNCCKKQFINVGFRVVSFAWLLFIKSMTKNTANAALKKSRPPMSKYLKILLR